MEIILLQDIEKLGFQNEIINVKPGYGRNFLIPKGMAILANASNKKVHNENMKQRAVKDAKIKDEAQTTAKALESTAIKVVVKAGEKGKIFGSVNTIMLADAIAAAGHKVDRKYLKILGEPIKAVGQYQAEARLHKDVATTFKFEVIAE